MQGDSHPTKLAIRDHRDRVIAQLTDSFARDELGLDSFETRIDSAYRCQSDEELDALVADLRSHAPPEAAAILLTHAEVVPAATELARVEPSTMVRAVFSNIERRDSVVLAPTSCVECVFGNVELDLRETRFAADVSEMRVRAVFGSIEIVVPADVTVEVHGSGVFGNFEGSSRMTADPRAPKLRVVGSAVFGSVVVRTAPPMRVQKLAAELRARRLLPP